VLLGNQAKVRSELLATLSHEFPDVDLTEAGFDLWASGAPQRVVEPAILLWLGSGTTGDSGPFQSLPLLPRLDISQHSDRLETVRAILHSALGR
jgi:hypothetical protein